MDRWTEENASESHSYLKRQVNLLKDRGLDASFYEPMVHGNPPLRAPFEGTVGEIDVHLILGKVYRELRRERYPDFVTGGPSFEVVTIAETDVQRRAILQAHAIGDELLRGRGEFTRAIYSESSSNPLVRLDATPLKGGNLIAGAELLVDNSRWQCELAGRIYKKIRMKACKNEKNGVHSSVIVNISRLVCADPLMLKRHLESMLRPRDSSVDSVLLASYGQGTEMRFVHVRNRYSSSALNAGEIGEVELTRLAGHPFLYCLPLSFKHGQGLSTLLQGQNGNFTITGTEVSGLTLGQNLTAVTAVAIEHPHALAYVRMQSGKESHTIHLN